MLFYSHATWQAIHQFTLNLMRQRRLAEVLAQCLPPLAEFLQAPYVSVDLLEATGDLVTYAATPGQPLEVGDRVRRGESGTLSWQAIDSGHTVSLACYQQWPHRRRLYDAFAIQAILVTPLWWPGRVGGTLNFLRLQPQNPFTPTEAHLAELLAQSVAVALANAQALASQLMPAAADPLQALLARQRQVLFLVAQGLSYREVGDKLALTERTVKFHMQAVRQRLGGVTRIQAIALAGQHWPRSVMGPTPAQWLQDRE